MTQKNNDLEKIKQLRKKFRNLDGEPSEKVLISLPNGITVLLESSEKDIQELTDLSISTANNIMEFHNELKSKYPSSYHG